jgi:hypothetical protein
VQNAAVVAGLVAAHRIFLFKHGDARAGKSFGEPIGRGKPDNTAADDGDSL